MRHSTLYTIGFAALVCVVCSFLVSTAAVSLKDYQDANALLEKQKNVLMAAGLAKPGEKLSEQRVKELFRQIEPAAIDLKTGEYTDAVDPNTYDPYKAAEDPQKSSPAPEGNGAQMPRLPHYALVYRVIKDGQLQMVVLPIRGKGLWSTMYGFLALDRDAVTVQGITFYQHGETPGLGGEVDNPLWKAKWPGRLAYRKNDRGQWEADLQIVKGNARNEHQVDGISGATLTSRGVSAMIEFWLGPDGYGPYLDKIRQTGSV